MYTRIIRGFYKTLQSCFSLCSAYSRIEAQVTRTGHWRTVLAVAAMWALPMSANADYQSDVIYLEALHPNVIYNIDVDVFIYERGCRDADTCTNGVRDRFGHLWFVAVGANLADVNGNSVGYMHGGLGHGNGISNNWFVDWSGYDNAGNPYPNSQGHNIEAHAGRWYRLRIWRTSWNGHRGCWGFWVRDLSTSGANSRKAGDRCVDGAYQLINPHQFVEIAEDDPCVTDVWGVHSVRQNFRDHDGYWKFSHATLNYENRCANTHLRGVRKNYWIDDREATRHNSSGDALW